jgi:hypothetical protein
MFVSTSAWPCCPSGKAIANAREYRSNYANVDYRMSVNLPEGLIGLGATPPSPNHGFTAAVPGSPRSCLSVEVYYVNPDQSAERHRFIERHQAPNRAEGLDHLQTAQTVLRRAETCDGSQTVRVHEELVAIASDGVRSGSPQEEVEYRISLDADEEEYQSARRLLIELAKSFRRLPAPKQVR